MTSKFIDFVEQDSKQNEIYYAFIELVNSMEGIDKSGLPLCLPHQTVTNVYNAFAQRHIAIPSMRKSGLLSESFEVKKQSPFILPKEADFYDAMVYFPELSEIRALVNQLAYAVFILNPSFDFLEQPIKAKAFLLILVYLWYPGQDIRWQCDLMSWFTSNDMDLACIKEAVLKSGGYRQYDFASCSQLKFTATNKAAFLSLYGKKDIFSSLKTQN